MTTAETSPVVHFISNHNRCCAMKEIIEIIARAIVDETDVVSATEIGGVHTLIRKLKVDKTDMGKVIGKQGCNAGAQRNVLSAALVKVRKCTVLEIVE